MPTPRNMLLDAFYSLGKNINKVGGNAIASDTAEGVAGERLPELTLDMEDSELIKLSDSWQGSWDNSDVKAKWIKRGEENENYWKGQHFTRPDVDKNRALVDNAIFEALETYLPQVTRRNPEAMVALAVGEEQNASNQAFAHALQLELGELADELKLRLKLKGVSRHKEIYLLGAVKMGWDLDKDMPTVRNIRPQKLILDPAAVTDEDGYTGERIGEHRQLPAWKLLAILKDEKESAKIEQKIKEMTKGDEATMIGFIEWWTNEYMFWKMADMVLTKRKNPHWNYAPEAPAAPELPVAAGSEAPEGSQNGPEEAQPDQNEPNVGQPEGTPAIPAMPELPGAAPATPQAPTNHFATQKMPYLLLATYTLGKQPVDETSLMGQNLANQDLINKRLKQIDKNADSMNNGMVVSLERSGLTQQQAKGVTEALRKGGTVAIPAGAPQDAIYRPVTPGLPADVYNQLVDVRNRVRDIFGTRGSSAAGLTTENTVRGKILNSTKDTDRIGGGISEYLEQFSDDLYNWIVQLLYVYDDRFVGAIAQGAKIPKIKVSVKEGSLLPKDSTTIANQAIQLSEGGKMATVDLYKRLDYPNPEELAANVWLEANAPELLFKDNPMVQQAIQMKQAAAQAAGAGEKKPPSQSINFKDLPPEGKAQMAKEVGIELHPEGIAAHDTANKPPPPATAQPAIPLPPTQ